VASLVFGGSREPGLGMVILCLVSVVLAALGTVLLVWAIAYHRLAYALTESAMRIEWLGRTVVVPHAAIQGIYSGQRLSGYATANVPRWPGINVGPRRVRGVGRLRFFATSTDQSALTFVTVEHGGVIISPRDPHEFQAALIERVEQSQALEGDVAVTWRQTPPTTSPWTALADPWLPACIIVGLLALLLIVAVIAFRFDALPDQIAVHFDASGQANQITSKFDLLRLPLFGLICLAIDWVIGVWVHSRERLLARLLWLGGAVVQVVLFIGVLRLVA
jgi:hypothetical protein